jgi:hypothetical protein
MSNTRMFLVTMAAFSMFALPAMADDQPHNWSGFYVGGNLGAASSNNSIGITTDTFNAKSPNAKPPLSALDQAAGPTSLQLAGARTSLPALQRPARRRPNNP